MVAVTIGQRILFQAGLLVLHSILNRFGVIEGASIILVVAPKMNFQCPETFGGITAQFTLMGRLEAMVTTVCPQTRERVGLVVAVIAMKRMLIGFGNFSGGKRWSGWRNGPSVLSPQVFLVILLNVAGQTVGTSNGEAAELALEGWFLKVPLDVLLQSNVGQGTVSATVAAECPLRR